MAIYAAVRAGALKSVSTGRGGILSAEYHAKRLDPVSQKRHVRDSPPIAWSKAGGPLDYVEAFRTHKRETETGERKGADLGIELKVIVSPDWLAETGDPRHADNPRVRQLVAEAKAWAESWGGEGAVWALRYDTDERGSGVVDVFMSPVRQQRHKNGKSKAVISCRKAKEELLASERSIETGLATSGAAMQSSWARWCQSRLDPRLERGKPKAETGAKHENADLVARVLTEEKAALAEREAALEAKKIKLDRRLERLKKQEGEVLNLREQAENTRNRERKRAEARNAFMHAYLDGSIERVGIDEKGQATVTFSEKASPSLRKYLTDLVSGWFNLVYDLLEPLQRLLDRFSVTLDQRDEVAREAGYHPDNGPFLE